MKKKIAILGSTGSIGRQALDVIEANPGAFEVEVLTAQSNKDLLIHQALAFSPNAVVIGNKMHYSSVADALTPHGIKVFAGEDALAQIVEMESIDTVLNALMGYAGFRPTIQCINAGKKVALANKESLVVGGELVSRMIQENHIPIIPVDSEHSAIFQCLAGEQIGSIEKIYLTASGGPFRNRSLDYLADVTKEAALKHPNWNMGDKITIDSASMMNKGLEVIEARWLFGVLPRQIEVIIHPQSIIHSMVQFRDGSIKAQLGLPDMRLPILYALSYPERMVSQWPRFDYRDHTSLTFETPDAKIFRNLALAYEALERGGNATCILNAANEVAVRAFLDDRIGFLKIPEIIEYCLEKAYFVKNPTYQDYVDTDHQTRHLANGFIGQ